MEENWTCSGEYVSRINRGIFSSDYVSNIPNNKIKN